MRPERLRELERRWHETSDPEDEARWHMERLRLGLITPFRCTTCWGRPGGYTLEDLARGAHARGERINVDFVPVTPGKQLDQAQAIELPPCPDCNGTNVSAPAEEKITLAAFLGDKAAKIAVGYKDHTQCGLCGAMVGPEVFMHDCGHGPLAWVRELTRWGQECNMRTALAACKENVGLANALKNWLRTGESGDPAELVGFSRSSPPWLVRSVIATVRAADRAAVSATIRRDVSDWALGRRDPIEEPAPA